MFYSRKQVHFKGKDASFNDFSELFSLYRLFCSLFESCQTFYAISAYPCQLRD